MKILSITNKLKNMNYLCIGACHIDNILKIQKEYKLERTNPVNSTLKLGGVVSNIANNLKLFTKNTKLFSLPFEKNINTKFFTNKIKPIEISNSINDSFYNAILDKNGKLIIGLASNSTYEKIKNINFRKIDKFLKNENYLILDLCFNQNLIEKIINYYYKKVKIYIAGTSIYKIHRIRKSLKFIDSLCLNEDELLALTKKNSLNSSINYIINKNKNINLSITRSNKPAIMILKNNKYLGTVPKIQVKNENGAGDAFASMFFLTLSSKLHPSLILSYSIAFGCLKAMDFQYKKTKYFNKEFNRILKKVNIKKYEKR